jgi:hypothetical protein
LSLIAGKVQKNVLRTPPLPLRHYDEEFRPREFARWGEFRSYYDIVALCRKCGHRTRLSVAWIDRIVRHDELMLSIERRLRCEECKRQRAIILVRRKPR